MSHRANCAMLKAVRLMNAEGLWTARLEWGGVQAAQDVDGPDTATSNDSKQRPCKHSPTHLPSTFRALRRSPGGRPRLSYCTSLMLVCACDMCAYGRVAEFTCVEERVPMF